MTEKVVSGTLTVYSNKRTNKQQTNKQTSKQASKQTNKQANKETHYKGNLSQTQCSVTIDFYLL